MEINRVLWASDFVSKDSWLEPFKETCEYVLSPVGGWGDFNEIVRLSEKLRGQPRQEALMENFSWLWKIVI